MFILPDLWLFVCSLLLVISLAVSYLRFHNAWMLPLAVGASVMTLYYFLLASGSSDQFSNSIDLRITLFRLGFVIFSLSFSLYLWRDRVSALLHHLFHCGGSS